MSRHKAQDALVVSNEPVVSNEDVAAQPLTDPIETMTPQGGHPYGWGYKLPFWILPMRMSCTGVAAADPALAREQQGQ